jgi:hypothetical protein
MVTKKWLKKITTYQQIVLSFATKLSMKREDIRGDTLFHSREESHGQALVLA